MLVGNQFYRENPFTSSKADTGALLGGGSWGARKQHDNLKSNLTLTQSEPLSPPPLKNPGYAPLL